MPEAEDFNDSPRIVYAVENLEWWQGELPNSGKLLIAGAFEGRFRRLRAASSRLWPSAFAAAGLSCAVGDDLGEVCYGRACDFDSEIHWGMSARISSIDLASAG